MKIMNASGCYCTTKEELCELYNCNYCDMIVSKSCTIKPLEGNPEPRYYHTDTLSINSTGLRNEGLHFYLSMAKYFYDLGKETGIKKRYIISFADLSKIKIFLFSITNYYTIHKIPLYFELNLSCPNIPDKGQIGYDFEETYKLLDYVFKSIDPIFLKTREINIGVKLPPYFDTIHFKKMTDVLNCFPLTHITCINSLGNGFVFNEDMEQSVAGNNGYGGIGGSVIKPFGLSNVRKFHQYLSPKIKIYGCGGIVTGHDIYEYEECGADVVQIGTELVRNGIGMFKHLHNELIIIKTYIEMIKQENESRERMNNKSVMDISKKIVNDINNRKRSGEKFDVIDVINEYKNNRVISRKSSGNTDKINTM